MKNVIVIKPGEAPVVKQLDDNGIKAELDGGWLESIPFTENALAFMDEEGKMKGLPINELATKLCERYQIGLHPGDVIVGTFIIVGPADMEGELTHVPQTLVEQIVTGDADWGQGKTGM